MRLSQPSVSSFLPVRVARRFFGYCCFSGNTMSYYDEIEIEDMAWDDVKRVFHYPCPCGDRFEITRAQLANYEDIAACPSCSLVIRVVYDPVSPS
jgi:diphthamide biosynthesis protein 3